MRFIKSAYNNAYLLLSLTSLFWAGNFVLAGSGVVAGHVPPVALSWGRWVLAFLLIAPFTYRYVKQDWPVIRQHFFIILALSFLGVSCFNTLAYIGLNHTPPINGLILQSIGPVLILIIAFFMFGEQVRLPQIFGISISLIGVLAIVTKGHFEHLFQITFNPGDLLILLAMVLWGFYTALLRYRPRIQWQSFTFMTFSLGALMVTPLFIAEMVSGKFVIFDTPTLISFAYVSIFPSILAYVFYNRGVELIGGNRAGVFLHMVPFFGTVLAITLLGHDLYFYHMIGFVLILSGVWLTSQKEKKTIS